MASPELLSTVGFKKGKIGSDDKEVGYQINESSLSGLAGGICLCFAVMGLMVVSMVYDVRFEKKNLHRMMRVEEHHAASKLAQVQMELWSQYRDDVQESHEARTLLKQLNSSYSEFQGKFRTAIGEFSKELNLHQDRSSKFAEKILHLVADMQEANLKHAKHLLQHLVESGKRGASLQKHVTREIEEQVEEEQKHIEEDGAAPDHPNPADHPHVRGASAADPDEEDPLKSILEGFWLTFDDYEKEFAGKARKNFKDGTHPVYKQLSALQDKLTGDNPPSEQEVEAEIEKIDLVGAGVGLGSGRVLPIEDIVEELVLIPKIPHRELTRLEKAWREGKKDSVTVLSQLQKWHGEGMVPSGWLQMGINNEEKGELKHEEEAEKEEKEKPGKKKK